MKSSKLLVIFLSLILFLSLRGRPGSPDAEGLQSEGWGDSGPLELSPERGRFALLYSLVEDKSFFFSVPLARFTTPDLGYSRGNYVSLFAPLVSILAIPGFVLGRLFDLSQVGAYATIVVFAIGNACLIRSICRQLHFDDRAATLAALVFVLATPAFPYAVSFYQHHISTFLILLSLYLVLSPKWWTGWVIWFLAGLSIPLDYPNLFLFAPVIYWLISRGITTHTTPTTHRVDIHFGRLLSVAAVIPPLLFFFWFNFSSYGNPLQFSGTVASVKLIGPDGKPALHQAASQREIAQFASPEFAPQKSSLSFFNSRNLLTGFITHTASPDRGLLVFSPVIALGILGFALTFRDRPEITPLLIAVCAVNLVLYSLWGDPWGGWAFGSRYLIPAYAVLAIGLAAALTHLRRNRLFLLLFFLLGSYSVAVNTVGALTSSRNPPGVEILELERVSGMEQKSTFMRNFDQLRAGSLKSLIYNLYFSRSLSAVSYYGLLAGSIISVLGLTTGLLFLAPPPRSRSPKIKSRRSRP